mgnify:FL=1
MSAKPAPSARDAAGQHWVRIEQPAYETVHQIGYPCAETETLLQGMARTGRKGIPVGCLGGGCGVCKIKVRMGSVRRVGPMSRAHVSVEEEAQGICLACRVAPLANVEVEVLGRLKKALGKAPGFSWSAGVAKLGASDCATANVKET